MRILLVGGTGFIGSRLFKTLVSEGFQVVVASRNPNHSQIKINPWEALEIKPNSFDLVINAAGKYGLKDDVEEKKSTIEANIGIATSIGRSTHLINKGVINLSSYFELANSYSKVGNSYYVRSKTLCNDFLEQWCAINQKYYSRIVLFDNYDKDISRRKFLDQLLMASLSGSTLDVKNTENVINLLSLRAICESISKVSSSYKTLDPQVGRIELKNSDTYRISELIDKVESISGQNLAIVNRNEDIDLDLQKVIFQKNHNQVEIHENIDNYLRFMLKKGS
ncbi:unannotated protein [freshwater metagenome]|uniref:Unannotated protein n=1 Tax=freshwater metagenome TaxID=449393 RepID=A0A6J6EBR9_9ZZZZ|nr:NAD-dependent epimerase/dehydratase family protein [Actinomycetota bacterium]